MRNSLYKDHLRRKSFFSSESNRLFFKALACNQILPVKFRLSFFSALHYKPRNSSITRLRNRCLITGRGRGVLPEFGLSRMEFKRRVEKGEIPGIRKAS